MISTLSANSPNSSLIKFKRFSVSVLFSLSDLVKTTVYEHRIDSLKKVKQKIIVKYKTKYVVSENITESVKTLKENLKCETY